MGEFLAFMVIVFTFGWGSVFLLHHLRRQRKELDQTVDHEVLARLLEDTDQLSARLTQLEEELHFFKDLQTPADRDLLPPPDELEEGK